MHYFVHKNLNHDGKEYRAGDTIEFEFPANTDLLLAEGVISDKPFGAAAPETAPAAVDEHADRSLQQVRREAVAGGQPLETGEPSIDGSQADDDTEGKDVTPAVEQTLDELTRPKLEELAVAEGIDPAAAKGAKNKDALIDLILDTRIKASEDAAPETAPAAPQEPENDPSANL